jgi:2-oxoglutarate dehydrogenase E2 component (dihydrolipoamide succinyltransferase)/2-oxoisovalerate dehydrogenase E2 component (dihydrolipoyl transacylase)
MMATDIIMPQLGESIAEGTVVKWLIPLGGAIEKDQSLLEVETERWTWRCLRRQAACYMRSW